jgi:hypothetical protein
MAHNHLEQLLAEWYEYKGYIVKRNLQVGKRKKGGFECELDIVAFHPELKHLVHLEPSLDADSWAVREQRFSKKFAAGKKYIKTLFPGLNLPDQIEQIAVLVFAAGANHLTLGGGKLKTVDFFMEEIFMELKNKRLESEAVPEQWPILRSFQYVNQYRAAVVKAWNAPTTGK